MLVNAHAPFKDGTLFSNYCVFVWTSKNDLKPQRVDADVLEKGAKKISVFRQAQSWTKIHVFTFYIFWGGEVRDWRKNILV